MPSVARSSLVRLAADGGGMVFGLISGVVSARWLEPSGKGALASLLFLVSLFVHLGSSGWGEAATLSLGRGETTFQQALSRTLASLAPTVAAALVGFLIASAALFRADLADLSLAILLAALCIPVSAAATVLYHFLIWRGGFAASSAVLLLTSGLVALGMWVFVAVVPLAVAGGALASLLGSAAGLLATLALLSGGSALLPSWDAGWFRRGLRYGAAIQLGALLTLASGRLDLLAVYVLAGQEAAGHYSVALTVGLLVSLPAAALCVVAFPRIARLGPTEARAFSARVCRQGLAVTLLLAVALLLAVPTVVPLVFGSAYLPAAAPAVLLVIASVFWSAQWLICRTSAARGNVALISRSFGTSLVVMLALDVPLIWTVGTVGAGAAAVLGGACGLLVCLRSRLGLRPAEVFPAKVDFDRLLGGARDALSLWQPARAWQAAELPPERGAP